MQTWKLKLFTAPHCPKCEVAISKQNELGLSFEITKDTNEAIKRGYKTVPMLEVEDTERDIHQVYNLQGILNLGGLL